jgi:tetratricopeptide (TPR) repeat protein
LWEQIEKEKSEGLSENNYYRALALEKQGRNQEAEAIFDQLASAAGAHSNEQSSSAMSLFLTGLGEKGKGHLDKARSAFREALKQDSYLWRARRELAK